MKKVNEKSRPVTKWPTAKYWSVDHGLGTPDLENTSAASSQCYENMVWTKTVPRLVIMNRQHPSVTTLQWWNINWFSTSLLCCRLQLCSWILRGLRRFFFFFFLPLSGLFVFALMEGSGYSCWHQMNTENPLTVRSADLVFFSDSWNRKSFWDPTGWSSPLR